jgi:HD superfamily phosphodiesterase
VAALFHDIGKPRKDMKNGHFYGHDVEGAKMTEEIMKRMKFSNDEIKRTVALVRNHMFYYPYVQEGMSEEDAKKIEERAWTDAAIRRFMARVGEENIEDLFALRIADATANPKTAFDPDEIAKLQERISEVREKDVALKISDLKITGDDLISMGVPKGPKVGEILNQLLEKVLDDPMLNTKERLQELAKKYEGFRGRPV